MRLRDAITGAERVFERLLGTYDNPPPATTDEALLELGARYKIEIVTDYEAEEENFSFSALDKAQLKNASDLIVSEFSLYSPEVIHASKLERLVLCSKLRGAEETVSGLADIGFLIVDTIFVNIDHVSKIWEHARRTVHHELFHCMDYHDDGYLDFEWRQLNSPEFTYWHMNNLTVKETHQPGFLQDYCQKSEWEDKAVVYSYMMVDHAELLERCSTDHVLARKVEKMKELLANISLDFNEEFWERMHERSLPHSGRKFSPKQNHKPVLLDSMRDDAPRGDRSRGDAGNRPRGDAGDGSRGDAGDRPRGDAGDGSRDDGSPDVGRIVITYERSAGKPTWLVNVEAREFSSQRFYTYNKLVQFLRKNGVHEVPQKDQLQEGTFTLSL